MASGSTKKQHDTKWSYGLIPSQRSEAVQLQVCGREQYAPGSLNWASSRSVMSGAQPTFLRHCSPPPPPSPFPSNSFLPALPLPLPALSLPRSPSLSLSSFFSVVYILISLLFLLFLFFFLLLICHYSSFLLLLFFILFFVYIFSSISYSRQGDWNEEMIESKTLSHCVIHVYLCVAVFHRFFPFTWPEYWGILIWDFVIKRIPPSDEEKKSYHHQQHWITNSRWYKPYITTLYYHELRN